MFLAAQPVSADPRLLLDSVPDRNLHDWVSEIGRHDKRFWRIRHDPGFHNCTTVSRRARGVGRSTFEIGPDRRPRPNGINPPQPRNLVDYEIREDGGIRGFYGRASDYSQQDGEVILFECISGETATFVELMRTIASAASFRGSWTVGVGARRASLASAAPELSAVPVERLFSEDTYVETWEVAHDDLDAAGSPILEMLLGRLARALDQDHAPMSDGDVFGIDPEEST